MRAYKPKGHIKARHIQRSALLILAICILTSGYNQCSYTEELENDIYDVTGFHWTFVDYNDEGRVFLIDNDCMPDPPDVPGPGESGYRSSDWAPQMQQYLDSMTGPGGTVGNCVKRELDPSSPEAVEALREHKFIFVPGSLASLQAAQAETAHLLMELNRGMPFIPGTAPRKTALMVYLPMGPRVEEISTWGNTHPNYDQKIDMVIEMYNMLCGCFPYRHDEFASALHNLLDPLRADYETLWIMSKSYAGHQVLNVIKDMNNVFFYNVGPSFGLFDQCDKDGCYADPNKVPADCAVGTICGLSEQKKMYDSPAVGQYIGNLTNSRVPQCMITSYNDCISLYGRGSAMTETTSRTSEIWDDSVECWTQAFYYMDARTCAANPTPPDDEESALCESKGFSPSQTLAYTVSCSDCISEDWPPYRIYRKCTIGCKAQLTCPPLFGLDGLPLSIHPSSLPVEDKCYEFNRNETVPLTPGTKCFRAGDDAVSDAIYNNLVSPWGNSIRVVRATGSEGILWNDDITHDAHHMNYFESVEPGAGMIKMLPEIESCTENFPVHCPACDEAGDWVSGEPDSRDVLEIHYEAVAPELESRILPGSESATLNTLMHANQVVYTTSRPLTEAALLANFYSPGGELWRWGGTIDNIYHLNYYNHRNIPLEIKVTPPAELGDGQQIRRLGFRAARTLPNVLTSGWVTVYGPGHPDGATREFDSMWNAGLLDHPYYAGLVGVWQDVSARVTLRKDGVDTAYASQTSRILVMKGFSSGHSFPDPIHDVRNPTLPASVDASMEYVPVEVTGYSVYGARPAENIQAWEVTNSPARDIPMFWDSQTQDPAQLYAGTHNFFKGSWSALGSWCQRYPEDYPLCSPVDTAFEEVPGAVFRLKFQVANSEGNTFFIEVDKEVQR